MTHTPPTRNASRDAEFFACREALAGCRGAALTRWGMSDCACAVRHSHILSRFFRRNAGRTPANLHRPALRRSAQFRRMIFGSAATLTVQNSGDRTANHFAVRRHHHAAQLPAIEKIPVPVREYSCSRAVTSSNVKKIRCEPRFMRGTKSGPVRHFVKICQSDALTT